MNLFDLADREVADTSALAFEALRPRLSELETEVFLLIWSYVHATGYQDVTGGELAAWAGRKDTKVRPRLTGLLSKGWVEKGPIRPSRAGELRCRGIKPVVPRSAIERMKAKGGG